MSMSNRAPQPPFTAAVTADAASARATPPLPPGAEGDATRGDPKRPIGENGLNADADVLSPKQRVAIEFLAAGRPLSQVMAECGVSRKTLYRWRHEDADFARELRVRRREVWGDVANQVRALVPRAVRVLSRQLDDPYDRARFEAAKAVLRMVDVNAILDEEGEEEEGE